MGKVAIFLTDMFSDDEYSSSVDNLKAGKYEIVHIGQQTGQMVHGKRGGIVVSIDKDVKSISADDYAALVIPGGYPEGTIKIDDAVVNLAHDFEKSGKPVFALCPMVRSRLSLHIH